MKCAILLSNLKLGGAERVAVNLANGLQERGFGVDLVLVEAVGELRREVHPDVRIVDLSAGRGRSAVRPFARYMRVSKPFVVLSITFEMNLVAGLAMLGMRRPPKLFMTVHNPLRRFAETSAAYRLLAMGLSRLLYPRADRVITVSLGVAEELLARKWTSAARIATIYNPVISRDFARLANAAVPANLRHDPSIPAIVNVGRLVPQKNQALLLDAFKLVTEQLPAQLWIVGEGPLRPELERRIDRLHLGESVQLLGHISNPLPVVRAADLFVQSSMHEGFGNVLVEAMGLGTPVISTDCPFGPREILEGGRWGKLVPPGDAQALADGILHVLGNGGIDARERAQDFTADRATGQYAALMRLSAG